MVLEFGGQEWSLELWPCLQSVEAEVEEGTVQCWRAETGQETCDPWTRVGLRGLQSSC